MTMAGKTATEELELTDLGGNGGGFRTAWTPPDPDGAAVPERIYVTGIWLALASILMFFSALTSSFLVRQGVSTDWISFALPRILWANTAVLIASSVTLELARRGLADGLAVFRRWWGVATALGMVFLAGQLVAWQQLRAAGVYLATNPSSSFFYVFTAAHGLHLFGGIVALLYVGYRRWPETARASRRTATTATGVYWHFLTGLWVLLLTLLTVRG